MKFLITSGGTKVPIDPVRDITNKSNGTFGSKIARTALANGHEVIFLHAKDSKTPFSYKVDLYKPDVPPSLTELFESCKNRYSQIEYVTFNDYYEKLRDVCLKEKPDVVVLAAAVSDYIVESYSDKKVKSSEDMTIKLVHAKKIISEIKTWLPNTCLVGFKMLVNATEEELKEASLKSIQNNGCDLVVANDYAKLLSGNHEVTIYTSNGHWQEGNKENNAKLLINAIEMEALIEKKLK